MTDLTSSTTPPLIRWTIREIVVAVLTAAVIIGLVIHGWTGKSQEARQNNASAVQDEFELRYHDVQTKLLVGLTSKESDASGTSSAIAEAAISNLISENPPEKFVVSSKAKFRARQAVLADILNRPSDLAQKLGDLEKMGPPYDGLSKELSVTLTAKDRDSVSPELTDLLGWMSGLATTKRQKAIDTAATLSRRITLGGAALAVAVGIGFVTLLVLIFLRVTGRMNFRFRVGPLPRAMRLEIFLVYMAIMTGASFGVAYIGTLGFGISQLDANIALMAFIPVIVLLWPLLQRHSFRSVALSLGLHPGSPGKLLSDVVIAPFFYLATWIVLLPLLMIYALIVKLMGFDMSQGAHPVFSWLIQDRDPLMFLKVAFLAVVVAPVLEEIMFRGALYSWLRSRLSAPIAIVSTAFIFAVIHPQGPLGVIPLMGIAIAFGILREWRGSLYAPMLAHACFNGGTLLLFWFATNV